MIIDNNDDEDYRNVIIGMTKKIAMPIMIIVMIMMKAKILCWSVSQMILRMTMMIAMIIMIIVMIILIAVVMTIILMIMMIKNMIIKRCKELFPIQDVNIIPSDWVLGEFTVKDFI